MLVKNSPDRLQYSMSHLGREDTRSGCIPGVRGQRQVSALLFS